MFTKWAYGEQIVTQKFSPPQNSKDDLKAPQPPEKKKGKTTISGKKIG